MAVNGNGAFKLSITAPLIAHCESEADFENSMAGNKYFTTTLIIFYLNINRLKSQKVNFLNKFI